MHRQLLREFPLEHLAVRVQAVQLHLVHALSPDERLLARVGVVVVLAREVHARQQNHLRHRPEVLRQLTVERLGLEGGLLLERAGEADLGDLQAHAA